MGKKSAANILKSISDSIGVPYHRVLFALGIRHVGETVAKTISQKFSSVDDLMNADIARLTAVREIGPKIASSIVSYFTDPDNLEIIRRLKLTGISLTAGKSAQPSGSLLGGKTIVISGVFKVHSRDEYKEIIEKNGGKNASSISGSTSFVLAGDNMGPSKKEKADELGVPLMSETEFLKIIGEE